MSSTCKIGICLLRRCLFAVVFSVLALWLCGCGSEAFSQPGETAAEGHRRHKRTLSINQQELMADIDTVLLMDEPSKLTERKVP